METLAIILTCFWFGVIFSVVIGIFSPKLILKFLIKDPQKQTRVRLLAIGIPIIVTSIPVIGLIIPKEAVERSQTKSMAAKEKIKAEEEIKRAERIEKNQEAKQIEEARNLANVVDANQLVLHYMRIPIYPTGGSSVSVKKDVALCHFSFGQLQAAG